MCYHLSQRSRPLAPPALIAVAPLSLAVADSLHTHPIGREPETVEEVLRLPCRLPNEVQKLNGAGIGAARNVCQDGEVADARRDEDLPANPQICSRRSLENSGESIFGDSVAPWSASFA
jgi:hypothetical protein